MLCTLYIAGLYMHAHGFLFRYSVFSLSNLSLFFIEYVLLLCDKELLLTKMFQLFI